MTLDTVERYRDAGRLAEIVMSTDSVFRQYRAVSLTPEAERLVRNGNPLYGRLLREGGFGDGELVRVYAENGEFLAVYRWRRESGSLRPEKMFL